MTIWILALILMGSCIALGHKMGAIRTAVSFIGILVSAFFAGPLGGLIRSLLAHIIKNPIWLWMLPPFIAFVILMIIFKSIGFTVHRKVSVYYKHYTGDLDQAWWERLNHRVGLCAGTLNGLAYLVIVCFVIYDLSYWTTQVATSSQEKFTVRLLNRAGHDLEATGMIKVARAVDPMNAQYFKMADLAGLLYQNPQLAGRLADYPPFLSLDERSEFKGIGGDSAFHSAWQSQGTLHDLLGNSEAKAILLDKKNSHMIWTMVATNLNDLQNYLLTGKSTKYTDPIFGRWHFNTVSTIALLSASKPNFSSADMRALRNLWAPAYAKTEFVAASDGQAFLKNLPHFKVQPKQPTTFDTTSYSGQWSGDGENYEVALANGNDRKSGTGKIGGQRLTLKLDGQTMIFDK